MRSVFEKTKRIYGCRRLRKALSEEGIELSEWKVRRIMRENGLYPETMKKYRPGKKEKSEGRYCTNMISQDFACDFPNRKRVGDITYLKTKSGWVYLAAVMDLYNREVIGYSVSKIIDTELACRALGNALHRKKKERNTGLSQRQRKPVQQQPLSGNADTKQDQGKHEQGGISLR